MDAQGITSLRISGTACLAIQRWVRLRRMRDELLETIALRNLCYASCELPDSTTPAGLHP